MKLQDQVCTSKQAKRLKELGVKQESLWMWVDWKAPASENKIRASTQISIHYHSVAKEITAENEGDEFDKEVFAAFTVAELSVMVKGCISGVFERGGKTLAYATTDEYPPYDLDSVEHLVEPDPAPLPWYKERTTQAVALADLLIFALENKLITPEQVNNSLTSAN